MEGLNKLTRKRNEYERIASIRKDNFQVIIPKEETLDSYENYPRFDELTDQMDQLSEEIMILRGRLQKTNYETMVTIEGEEREFSLGKLLLEIEKLANDLKLIASLKSGRGYLGIERRRITKTDEEQKEVFQKTDLELEKMIKELEDKKLKYELIRSKTNATTHLLEL